MKLKTTIFIAIFLLITSSMANALTITCSLFPVYDFARAIVGENAEVKLLLQPGVEPHEFEPSAMDVKALNDSDVFIFTGNLMEHWAEKISRSLNKTKIINASENINIINNDPHVWLDLSRAQEMINNILAGLCEISPEQAQTFTSNAKIYCSKLAELDKKFFALTYLEYCNSTRQYEKISDERSPAIADGKFSSEYAADVTTKSSSKNADLYAHKTLVFAGEFSAQYFMRRYGFNYISAYEGENEPSIKKLAQVIKFIRENEIKYIFSEPLNIPQVTRSISEETNTEILSFDTCHNVKDINMTLINIMTSNYNNIARALND